MGIKCSLTNAKEKQVVVDLYHYHFCGSKALSNQLALLVLVLS